MRCRCTDTVHVGHRGTLKCIEMSSMHICVAVQTEVCVVSVVSTEAAEGQCHCSSKKSVEI